MCHYLLYLARLLVLFARCRVLSTAWLSEQIATDYRCLLLTVNVIYVALGHSTHTGSLHALLLASVVRCRDTLLVVDDR